MSQDPRHRMLLSSKIFYYLPLIASENETVDAMWSYGYIVLTNKSNLKLWTDTDRHKQRDTTGETDKNVAASQRIPTIKRTQGKPFALLFSRYQYHQSTCRISTHAAVT